MSKPTCFIDENCKRGCSQAFYDSKSMYGSVVKYRHIHSSENDEIMNFAHGGVALDKVVSLCIRLHFGPLKIHWSRCFLTLCIYLTIKVNVLITPFLTFTHFYAYICYGKLCSHGNRFAHENVDLRTGGWHWIKCATLIRKNACTSNGNLHR